MRDEVLAELSERADTKGVQPDAQKGGETIMSCTTMCAVEVMVRRRIA